MVGRALLFGRVDLGRFPRGLSCRRSRRMPRAGRRPTRRLGPSEPRRGIKFRIGVAHDQGHGAAAERSATWCRLASISNSAIMARVIPAMMQGSPSPRIWSLRSNQSGVRSDWLSPLSWIGDNEALFFRKEIPARTPCEIIGFWIHRGASQQGRLRPFTWLGM